MLLPELPARGVRVEALRMLTDMARTARRRRALTDSIAFVVHTTVRISTSKARNGTNSAHASVHSRMIAGYQRSHLSENSAKRSDAAWSEEAV